MRISYWALCSWQSRRLLAAPPVRRQARRTNPGHVYRADTHTPLAEVTMILQVATGAVASFRTVQTAADGSYSFDNLKAKYYTLAAWKTGFVGRYYGVDTPNSRRRRKAAPGSGPARPYLWGSDGKLYAWFWSNRKRYVVATADSISEIDQPPSDVAAALARWKPGGVLTPRTQENTW